MNTDTIVLDLIIWILLSISVGFLGSERKIGGLNAFLLSLFLSPIVGVLFVFNSKRDDTIEFENKLLESNNNIARILTNTHNASNKINEDEL